MELAPFDNLSTQGGVVPPGFDESEHLQLASESELSDWPSSHYHPRRSGA